MPTGEELEVKPLLGQPGAPDHTSKGQRGTVEVILVPVTGIEPEAAQTRSGRGMLLDQAHGVVREPSLPPFRQQRRGLEVDRELPVAEHKRAGAELDEQRAKKICDVCPTGALSIAALQA